MIDDLILKKGQAKELSMGEYYEAVDYLMKNGIDKTIMKFFICLGSFGMTKKEVLRLTLAMRDSGRVLKYNQCVLEKHSTGGIGDSTSVVIIPLLASLGYKIIKTTAKSFVFTNGTADRFGAIPNFKTSLTDAEILNCLTSTNACVLSHNGDMCPADRLLFDLRERAGLETDINLLAASIACKKLASGAKVVLVDVKYGQASMVPDLHTAKALARILKYIFKKCDVRCVVALTDTKQTIGDGIGNAVEMVDAINVLKGEKCLLRDVSVVYATEIIKKANPKLPEKDIVRMINSSLDEGYAYERFLSIVNAQGGDVTAVKNMKFFKPYNTVNFVSDRSGYVGNINSLLLGELIRKLCAESHDSNVGVRLNVKIGDKVEKGEVILSFYYKDKADLEKYRSAILGCVRVTEEQVKPVKVITKVYR